MARFTRQMIQRMAEQTHFGDFVPPGLPTWLRGHKGHIQRQADCLPLPAVTTYVMPPVVTVKGVRRGVN